MDSSNGAEIDQQHSIFDEYKDLNIDLCFEIVFPYLDVRDLVNVADSCKVMKTMAELTFHRKYRKAWNFILSPNGHSSKHEVQSQNQKDLLDMKTCFGFLRCFGHMLSNLKLNNDHSSFLQSSRLNEYVIKYCVSVNEIEFSSNIRRPSAESVISFLDICKSLKKVIFKPQNTLDYKYLIQWLNNRQTISITIDKHSPTLKVICNKY